EVMLQLKGVEFLTRHGSHLMRTRRRRQTKGTHQYARANPMPAMIATGPMASRASEVPAESSRKPGRRTLQDAPRNGWRATPMPRTSLHTMESISWTVRWQALAQSKA